MLDVPLASLLDRTAGRIDSEFILVEPGRRGLCRRVEDFEIPERFIALVTIVIFPARNPGAFSLPELPVSEITAAPDSRPIGLPPWR